MATPDSLEEFLHALHVHERSARVVQLLPHGAEREELMRSIAVTRVMRTLFEVANPTEKEILYSLIRRGENEIRNASNATG